jgi:UDP-glucuronate 4-epimerase
MARVLITGASGCIGAWTIRLLLEEGHEPIGVDLGESDHRLRLLGVLGHFSWRHLDLAQTEDLFSLLEEVRPDAVIHLAALQVPFCRADPLRCVKVNVQAFQALLEGARRMGFPLVYASSAAVYGPATGNFPFTETQGLSPQSLYGVFKLANEGMARVYGRDYGVTSVGLRPFVVYGPGRDQGITADITLALWHAARGQAFQIRFGGSVALQHAEDVARAFVVAALRPGAGARVYNLRGEVLSLEEVVQHIEGATGNRRLVTHVADPLPIAPNLSDEAWQKDYGPFGYKPFPKGLRETLEVWRAGALL